MATSLLQIINARKIITFCRASIALVQPESLSEQGTIAKTIARFLSSIVIPETESLSDKPASETRASVVRLMLELNCTGTADIAQWVTSKILRWYADTPEWAAGIKKSFYAIVSTHTKHTTHEVKLDARSLVVIGRPLPGFSLHWLIANQTNPVDLYSYSCCLSSMM